MEKLERGSCLFISKNEIVVENNIVYLINHNILFKIGEIPKEEISWFGNQINKDAVVYLGKGVFSFKRFVSALEEFETLSDKESALTKLLIKLDNFVNFVDYDETD